MPIRVALLAIVVLCACARTTARPMPDNAGQGAGAAEANDLGGSGSASFGAGTSGTSGGVGGSAATGVAAASGGSAGFGDEGPCLVDGQPCMGGLGACCRGTCAGDCYPERVYGCEPACTGGAAPNQAVVDACSAFNDSSACFAHETGGYPSRCRWTFNQPGWGGGDCATGCEVRDEATCESSDFLCEKRFAARAQGDGGEVFAACVEREHRCADAEDTPTCAASTPSRELWVFATTCVPPGWPLREPSECGLPACETLDNDAGCDAP